MHNRDAEAMTTEARTDTHKYTIQCRDSSDHYLESDLTLPSGDHDNGYNRNRVYCIHSLFITTSGIQTRIAQHE